jgi:hypothetical protein
MRHKIEICCLVLTVVVVVAVEAACIYAICYRPSLHKLPAVSVPSYGYWISPTLPQCWILGGVLVLLYRLIPPAALRRGLTSRGNWVNRKLLMRHWALLIALAIMQACALYLDYSAAVHR